MIPNLEQIDAHLARIHALNAEILEADGGLRRAEAAAELAMRELQTGTVDCAKLQLGILLELSKLQRERIAEIAAELKALFRYHGFAHVSDSRKGLSNG